MKVLILGGMGYIGTRLCRELQNIGMEVGSVDLLWFGLHRPKFNIKQDISRLRFRDLESYDAIILLAGHSSIAMCEADPESAVNNNVRNFEHLLSILRPDQCFIYASSAGVYGQSGETIVNETYHISSPSLVYVETKLAIEKLARESSHTRWWGLRFGTVCGGSPNLRIDLMVNAMYHSAIQSGLVVSFGGVIHRPILGMKDLVNGIMCVLESKAGEGQIYNLASVNVTNYEVAEVVSFVMKVSFDCDDSQKDHNDFVVDFSLFERTFDWHPQENIESMVKDLEQYYMHAYKGHRRGTVKYD